MDVKQVIVIRKDLKMRRGKEITQGAHASMAWLTNRMNLSEPDPSYSAEARAFPGISLSLAEWCWVAGNFRKITCQVSSEEELLALHDKAKAAELVTELITDAGLTEFDGPTVTALAIGPDYDDKIDKVTGDLKLY